MKYDVFISYRREGGYDTAKHINDLLVRDGYRVSFDIDTLRNGDFDVQLLDRIEECKDFILIVDQHAFDRTLDPEFDPKKDWLRCELAHALKHNKNIIPVFLSGVTGFPDGLPVDIVNVTKKNGPEYNKYYFNEFYRQLRFRFIKSYSLKTKLAVMATLLSLVVILAITLINTYFSEEKIYIDPLVPDTTSEAEFVEFSRNKIREKSNKQNQIDSILQSKEWYNLAQHGDVEAQLCLGLCYCTGYGGEKDYKEAVRWFRKAAEGGDATANYALAVCYDNELGVKMDLDLATELYYKAAEQGLVEAQCDYALACIYKKMGRSEAFNWLSIAVEQEYARAMYALGYFSGQGQGSQLEDAIYWMEKAALNYKYPMAQLSMANIYLSYYDNLRDEELGIQLLEDLCETDNVVALYSLACCYVRGNGVEQDKEKALELLTRAVEKNYAPALTDMGTLYLYGANIYNIEQKFSKAMELFLEAANQGYPMAQYYIGQMYYNGTGVKKSKYKGDKWSNKAYKQGFNPQLLQQQQQQQNIKYFEDK